MKFKFFLAFGVICNLIINTNSVDAGFVFPVVFTYLVNVFKVFLIFLFLYKTPTLRKIPTYFKYLICFEFFIFFYGLIFNSEYYQLKNTFLYFLPQIISLPIAFIYYKKISINIKFITRLSVLLLIFGFTIGIDGLVLQKTFAYFFILGIIHFARSEYKYFMVILLLGILLVSLGFESRITILRLFTLIFCVISYFFLKLKIVIKYSKKIIVSSALGLFVYLSFLAINIGRINFDAVESDGHNLLADTRSFIYFNVINSLESTKEIFIGRGASAKYESHFVGTGGSLDEYRFRTEVDVLNKFLYGGIFYILIFLFVIFNIKDVSLKTRENKMIEIFLILFLLMSFVENTSEYSTLWLLFWFLVLNYKYDRLHSINTHT